MSSICEDSFATVATVDILQQEKANPRKIFLQHKSGPCPIIALANCLSLLDIDFLQPGDIDPSKNRISIALLIERLSEHLEKINQSDEPNLQQNLADVIRVLSKSSEGIDVNIKFDNVTSFEVTPQVMLFELICIPLYHCWVVDPEDTTHAPLISSMTYNQMIDTMVAFTVGENSNNEPDKRAIMQNFINETATQMTLYGVKLLQETMIEDSYGVIFHNNHFSTITKHNNCLYTLASSFAFEGQNEIVWESLLNCNGCGKLYDGCFKPFSYKEKTSAIQTRSSHKNELSPNVITATPKDKKSEDK